MSPEEKPRNLRFRGNGGERQSLSGKLKGKAFLSSRITSQYMPLPPSWARGRGRFGRDRNLPPQLPVGSGSQGIWIPLVSKVLIRQRTGFQNAGTITPSSQPFLLTMQSRGRAEGRGLDTEPGAQKSLCPGRQLRLVPWVTPRVGGQAEGREGTLACRPASGSQSKQLDARCVRA